MDFGIYFQITNHLPLPLYFSRFESSEGTCCAYAGPQEIPNDGAVHTVHLNDPCGGVGAEGTAFFIANVDGSLRQYAWYGNCPVWSPTNNATGPGITAFNTGGHPLTVNVAIDSLTPGWTQAAQPIQHVFVLMLENRSFDHLLGFSGITGTDAASGEPTSIVGLTGTESNSWNGTSYPVTHPADWTMPVDPPHELPNVVVQLAGEGATYPAHGPYPPVNNSGFVDAYAAAGGQANPGEVMKCFAPDQLPVLTALAAEFAVCDGWYSSLPGPTWPNRFFMMAASAGGLDCSPTTGQIVAWETGVPYGGFAFEHGSLFDAVAAAGKSWRIYRGDVGPLTGSMPIAAGLKGVSFLQTPPTIWGFSVFASHLKGDYPYAFTLIEPNYGDAQSDTYSGGTSQHPIDDVRGGEALIKQTYEAIRSSPLWTNSLLIVTWDEHGGFYDHVEVEPGGAVEPGDKQVTPGPGTVNEFGFTFDTYGVRVPAVIVSPYIARNVIDHRTYDHSSIPATVEQVFGLKPLTARDAAARDLTPLLTLATPRDTPTTLPSVPAPAPAATAGVLGRAPAPDDNEPIGESNLAGFVGVAMKLQLELAQQPDARQAITERVAGLHTRGEAREYVAEIAERLQELTASTTAVTNTMGQSR